MTTKKFPIGDVVATHSGIVLANGQWNGICAVANHIVGQHLMTHRMAFEADRIANALALQHPWLTSLDVPSKDKGNTIEQAAVWLDDLAAVHGETLNLHTDPGYIIRNSQETL
jgi:hypothetical protein